MVNKVFLNSYKLIYLKTSTNYVKLSNSIVYWTTKKRSKYLVEGPIAQINPFDYWVAHHGYILTSCSGLDNKFITIKQS